MNIHTILLPYDSGHRDARMGRGPLHLRERGAIDRLRAAGHDVIESLVEAPDAFPTEIGTSFALYRVLAEDVRATVTGGAFPLTLAGNCGWLLGGRAGCWVTLSDAASSACVTGRYWQQRAACGRSMQPSAGVPSVQRSSIPPAMDVPPVRSCITVEPHHASVVDNAAKVFARVAFAPPLARHAIGSRNRENSIPRPAVAIGSRYDVIASRFRARFDGTRCRKQVKSESGIRSRDLGID